MTCTTNSNHVFKSTFLFGQNKMNCEGQVVPKGASQFEYPYDDAGSGFSLSYLDVFDFF